MKVYSRFPEQEFVYRLPDHLFHQGWIMPGYYTVELEVSESQMEKFVDWTFSQPELKVIGVTYNKTPKQ